ncbi:hypothetical protein ACFIOY_29990 [Bradyrhizobium sp. TZ2]
MNDVEKKPALGAANDNAWYCLATLYGEQPIDGFDRELAEKNGQSWNRWFGDLTEGERASYEPVFARRIQGRKVMLPERAGSPDFSHTHFDRKLSFKAFLFPTGANFTSSNFSEDDHRGRAKTHQRGSDFGGGDAHRVFTAAQNCSVTAVVSSVTFQPFVSAFSLANFCSI